MAHARSGRTAAMAMSSVALVCAWGAASPARLRAAPDVWVFPLRVHASSEGDTKARDAWIDAQVASANRLYAAFDVAFAVHERVPLAERYDRVETRADLEQLGALLEPRTIDVFVVQSLDVTDPASTRALGLCPASPGAGFVVMVAGVDDPVLAHELGHYFGVDHTEAAGN